MAVEGGYDEGSYPLIRIIKVVPSQPTDRVFSGNGDCATLVSEYLAMAEDQSRRSLRERTIDRSIDHEPTFDRGAIDDKLTNLFYGVS